MQRTYIFSIGALLALELLLGVAPRAEEDMPPARLPASHPDEKTEAAPSAPAPEEPAGALTLQQALALARVQNPELAATTWKVRAGDAVRLQAGLLPNPEGHADLEDVAGTGAFRGGRRAQTTLRLSQLVELGGKRSARIQAGSRAVELAVRESESKRIEVLAEVTERFVNVVGDQQKLDLSREATELAEATLRAVGRRVEAGKASLVEEKKARVALVRSRIAEEHAEHELGSARKRLVASWGSPAPIFTRAEGDLFRREPIPPYPEIEGRIARSPELLRSVAEAALRRTEIDVEESKATPDFTLSAGVRRFEEPDAAAAVFGLSAPLPIFNRNQGGTGEARANYRKADEARRAAEVQLHAKLYGLYQELRHAATEMEAMEKEILPEVNEALRISREGFDLGKFSFLELLDTQRTFLEVKNEYIQAASRYHRFLTRIERIIGGSL